MSELRAETYFIGAYSKTGRLKAVKVGIVARGQIAQRIRVLQTGSIDKLILMGLYFGPIEKKIHRKFRKSRLRARSEFFKPTPELLSLIKTLNQVTKLLVELEHLTQGVVV